MLTMTCFHDHLIVFFPFFILSTMFFISHVFMFLPIFFISFWGFLCFFCLHVECYEGWFFLGLCSTVNLEFAPYCWVLVLNGEYTA